MSGIPISRYYLYILFIPVHIQYIFLYYEKQEEKKKLKNYYMLHFNTAAKHRTKQRTPKKYVLVHTSNTKRTNEFNEWKEMNFFDARLKIYLEVFIFVY